MPLILNLETSTSVCSVSLFEDEKVIAVHEQADAKSHASQLIPFIAEVLEKCRLTPKDLSAIAVSKGPGSYTGLRIGVSTAKGMAYALNLPLIAVGTLHSMASGFLNKYPEYFNAPALLCPMIDARRMEVYSCVYNQKLREIRSVEAEIIHPSSFLPLLKDYKIHFFGDGAMKCKEMILHENAVFHDNFHPSAEFMGLISNEHFKNKVFEDLAYFEPFYLKDFVTTTAINKMI